MSTFRQFNDHEQRITRNEQAILSSDFIATVNILEPTLPENTILDLEYAPTGSETVYYEIDGPVTSFNATAVEFEANAKHQILRNNVPMDKGRDAIWISPTQVKLVPEIQQDEELEIVYQPHPGGSAGLTMAGLASEVRDKVDRSVRIGIPAWQPSLEYMIADKVTFSGGSGRRVYESLVDHISESLFDTDLLAGKWGVIDTSAPCIIHVGSNTIIGEYTLVEGSGIAIDASGVPGIITITGGKVNTTSVDDSGRTDGDVLTYNSSMDKVEYKNPTVNKIPVDTAAAADNKILALTGGTLYFKTVEQLIVDGKVGTKTVDESALESGNYLKYNGSQYESVTYEQPFSVSVAGSLFSSSGIASILVPYNGTILDVQAHVYTESATSNTTVDVEKNGTSVFGALPLILSTENTHTPVIPTTTEILKGDVLGINIELSEELDPPYNLSLYIRAKHS